ncbi:hypothetical protein EV715DRAFT_296160 [Schizophyllum commune]
MDFIMGTFRWLSDFMRAMLTCTPDTVDAATHGGSVNDASDSGFVSVHIETFNEYLTAGLTTPELSSLSAASESNGDGFVDISFIDAVNLGLIELSQAPSDMDASSDVPTEPDSAHEDDIAGTLQVVNGSNWSISSTTASSLPSSGAVVPSNAPVVPVALGPVAPAIVAPSVVAPPVVAPPVVAPAIVAPPVVAPPVITPAVVAPTPITPVVPASIAERTDLCMDPDVSEIGIPYGVVPNHPFEMPAEYAASGVKYYGVAYGYSVGIFTDSAEFLAATTYVSGPRLFNSKSLSVVVNWFNSQLQRGLVEIAPL